MIKQSNINSENSTMDMWPKQKRKQMNSKVRHRKKTEMNWEEDSRDMWEEVSREISEKKRVEREMRSQNTMRFLSCAF